MSRDKSRVRTGTTAPTVASICIVTVPVCGCRIRHSAGLSADAPPAPRAISVDDQAALDDATFLQPMSSRVDRLAHARSGQSVKFAALGDRARDLAHRHPLAGSEHSVASAARSPSTNSGLPADAAAPRVGAASVSADSPDTRGEGELTWGRWVR